MLILNLFWSKDNGLLKKIVILYAVKQKSMNYELDPHGEKLLQQYRDRLHVYERIEEMASRHLEQALKQQHLYVTSIEHRIKGEKSLVGKLELKGSKYNSLDDITDILGMRVITFYTDDVDKVAAIVKSTFDVDWNESVDKRKQHELHSFGYSSLHYICRLPKTIVDDPEMPELNEYRFEVQMRTTLQHVWSTIEHDAGYKGDIKIPDEYRRQFSRLAGLLELADDEFSRLRTAMTDYRRQMLSLVASGKLDEVLLSPESFRNYLETKPFDRLNKRIAAVNQAEIYPTPLLPFARIFDKLEFTTLGDVDRLIKQCSDDAYLLAVSQLALTDLDIMAESVAPTNLCIVHILKNGGDVKDLTRFYDLLNGEKSNNAELAASIFERAGKMPFMQRGKVSSHP